MNRPIISAEKLEAPSREKFLLQATYAYSVPKHEVGGDNNKFI